VTLELDGVEFLEAALIKPNAGTESFSSVPRLKRCHSFSYTTCPCALL
jgi:hypothetical protein